MINSKSLHRVPVKLWLFGVLIIVLLVGGVIGTRAYYNANLASVSSNPKTVILNIPNGATVSQIGQLLKQDGLIRSTWVFNLYIHSVGLGSNLEAGTFALSPSDTTQQIASIIASGHVAEGTITILPGKTIFQVEDALINAGLSPADVRSAVSATNYSGLSLLSNLPPNISNIEGLLYPDTFDKTSVTHAAQIFTESLIEMNQHLTPALRSKYAAEGLSVYQAITLASIIQQEVAKPSDMAQVAQVFLTRLSRGSPLGSDVTANYGAVAAGVTPSLSFDSPYNTLIHAGLPPTPIGTISENALLAVANPTPTNWLYFVTGDNGTTYFETNIDQHNADAAAYCHKLCAIP